MHLQCAYTFTYVQSDACSIILLILLHLIYIWLTCLGTHSVKLTACYIYLNILF